MSGGKATGVAHQVIDLVRKIEARQDGKIAEVIKKHNDLAAAIAAVEGMVKQIAAFTASEMGKFQAETVNRLGILARSTDGIDLNVLALAEMAKEVIGQLTQADTIFKKLHAAVGELVTKESVTNEDLAKFNEALTLSEEETAKIRTDASDWYKNLVMSSFKIVQEKRAAAEKEAIEAEAKAQAEAKAAAEAAEKAEQDKTEAAVVNEELKAASDAERTVVANQTGGPGSAFPEGADIFGG